MPTLPTSGITWKLEYVKLCKDETVNLIRPDCNTLNVFSSSVPLYFVFSSLYIFIYLVMEYYLVYLFELCP